MKKLLVIALLVSSYSSFSGTFTSIASGAWNNPAIWTVVADADGVPDQDDNVTISPGHTVTNNITNSRCRNLTVQGTLASGSVMVLYTYGNYVLSGAETGSGAIVFAAAGPGLTISGAGTFGTSLRYTFATSGSRTIQAGTTINKTGATGIASCTITNLGNVSLSIVNTNPGATWINSTNSSLLLRNTGFMASRVFTANATGNTVRIAYTTGTIPLTTAGYYNLILQSSVTGTKTLTANTVVANNLSINNLNTLNSNNFDLTVGGNWLKNGSFTASAARTVTFNGTSAQTLSGTATTTFTNLLINNTNGVSITSGSYILSEVLTINNGTFNTMGNNFTMTSTAVSTARIAPITGTGAIAGNFIIQRFISSRTQDPADDPGHWTDLASPVQSSVMADWDNELFLFYTDNPPTSTANIYAFSEPLEDWVEVNAATTLTPGRGFEVALTDDGSLTSFSNTTLNTIGVPNNGNQNLSSLISFAGSGENLVGNPFASSIDWSSVFGASSSILNTYDVFEADAGSYVTYGLGSEIAAGQGFWVYTTAGGATLNVPEVAKTASSNSSIRQMNLHMPYLSLTLKQANKANPFYHTLKIAANAEASDGWDLNDHPFRKSPNKNAPSITSKTFDNKELTINTFNSSNSSYSLSLTTQVGRSGNYTLDVSGIEFMPDYTCFLLEDKTGNKWYDLSQTGSINLDMNVNDVDRFVLHFSRDGDCKSGITGSIASSFESSVQVLPSESGNVIQFGLSETTPVTIQLMNMLGQQLAEEQSIVVGTQSVNLVLPADFSGMYMVRVVSEKETITKKFVRK